MAKPNPNASVTHGHLMDAVDTIMRGIDGWMEKIDQRFKKIDQRFKKIDQRFKKIDQRFKKIDQHFDKLKADVLENRRRIDDIKTDLSDTPTRKEFNELKSKVHRFHPTN
ncbi:MAG: hypothetical protein HYS86_02155 [Candidatus Chisholmbacteria bacterium]|nr:hypothetical protein [Candidatus Chisholmbacteria bacterium]